MKLKKYYWAVMHFTAWFLPLWWVCISKAAQGDYRLYRLFFEVFELGVSWTGVLLLLCVPIFIAVGVASRFELNRNYIGPMILFMQTTGLTLALRFVN